MADEVDQKLEEEGNAYAAALHTAGNYRCGECGGLLVVLKVEDEWGVLCGPDNEHNGLSAIADPAEIERSGGSVPAHVSNQIERYAPPATSLTAYAGIWQSKFPSLTPAGAYQAALYSIEVGVDPRHGEVACIEFSRDGVKVPTMMITGKGWRTLAAREMADLFDRAPIIQDIRRPEDKEDYDAGPDDWCSIAVGRLKGDHESLPNRVGVGVYTRKQRDAAMRSTAESSRDLPAAENPQNQARRRAERHWYEENCPQAIERARQGMVAVINKLDMEGAVTVLEAEFTDLSEGTQERPQQRRQASRGGQRRPQQPASAPASSDAMTQAQRGKILAMARDNWGHDAADIEREIGKPLDKLTKSQASELIDEYQRRISNPTSEQLFDGLGSDNEPTGR